jgi:hypothetical protein
VQTLVEDNDIVSKDEKHLIMTIPIEAVKNKPMGKSE